MSAKTTIIQTSQPGAGVYKHNSLWFSHWKQGYMSPATILI